MIEWLSILGCTVLNFYQESVKQCMHIVRKCFSLSKDMEIPTEAKSQEVYCHVATVTAAADTAAAITTANGLLLYYYYYYYYKTVITACTINDNDIGKCQ